jgi:peptidoglycan/xylan/chitin deacetylase (PgdA/CDA1 family)
MIENQKWPLTHWNRENPEISLTFDDGYWAENIKHILDTLRWSWIKATFFILGDCLKDTPSLWKQAVEEWHQVCCHTFSHIYLSDWVYTDLWDKAKGIKAWPWGLNETNLNEWTNNVSHLLWADYLNKIQAESWEWFPRRIKSDLLLRTEILMWEAQIKRTLGEEYLNKFKIEHPFFRFPWGCGATATRNINVLKEMWYLSIGWSDDFFRWAGKARRHMTLNEVKNVGIRNWDIPLFHFKKSYWPGKTTEWAYIDAYIENMKNKNKWSKTTSEIIR